MLCRTLPLPVPIAQDPELIGDFVNEASEHLATIESEVLALERDPLATDPLHAAFRSFHTIKGLAGFLELDDIRAVAHEVETLLDRARNGELAVTPALTDIVLESADYLQRAVRWVEGGLRGNAGAAPETATILAKVSRALEESAAIESPSPAETPTSLAGPAERGLQTIKTSFDQTIPSDNAVQKLPPKQPAMEVAAADKPALEKPDAEKAADTAAFTIRIDTAKLDHMMDMVGELVIAQSLLTHAPELTQNGGRAAAESAAARTRIDQRRSQRMAMSLRMTPVNQLFTRMTRLVRDLARKTGKRVRLELSGEETELDKTIIERLGDPLMHMVRNSLDHGLEHSREPARPRANRPKACCGSRHRIRPDTSSSKSPTTDAASTPKKSCARRARKDWCRMVTIPANPKSII